MSRISHMPMALALAVAAAALWGCPPVPSKPTDGRAGQTASKNTLAAIAGDAPSIGFEPVAKGIYVPVGRDPLSAADLAKAKTPREKVGAAIDALLAAASTQPATKPAAHPDTQPAAPPALQAIAQAAVPDAVPTGSSAEPPSLAIKLYLRGREKFLEGANSEAMAQLEQALALDPGAFTVLRLMGRVSFAGAQLPRGVTYLERAHALRPHDVEVNYLLGRYWLERNDNLRAASYLLQAVESPDKQITSTQTPLSSFYLAVALQQAGFNLAAANEFEHFMETAELPIAGYRYDNELNFLISMEWSADLSAAENDARVDDFKAALPHYQKAAAARPDDPFIASRLVRALVLNGQAEPARQAALTLLTTSKGSEDSAKLAQWTFAAVGKRQDFIRDVRAALSAPGNSESQQETQAVTLASVLDHLGQKRDAFAALQAFCEAHPARLGALSELLKRVDSADTFRQALAAAAQAIAADPTRGAAVWQIFAPIARGAAAESYLKSRPAPGGDYAQLYLLALTQRAHEASLDVVEHELHDAVLASPPAFFVAREELVGQLLSEEKFSQADQLIDQLFVAPGAGEQAWQLRIDSQISQERLISAQTLAREAKEKFPADADFRIQLVSIERLRGMDADADSELQDMVRDLPRDEAGYRLLINALFARGRRGVSQEATTAAVVAAVNKLLDQVPDSRFARITAGIVYARQGRYDDAQTILQDLLSADPDLPEALVPMAQIMHLSGKPGAEALLEASLKRRPNADVARALIAMYGESGKEKSLALTKRLADENPDSEVFASLYAGELLAQNQKENAAAWLAAAQKRMPRSEGIAMSLARLKEQLNDDAGAIAIMQAFMKANGETTDRLALLSHLYSDAGNLDASVAALEKVLTIMPDNIGANNDLGYFWANEGVHLDQAEAMIKKALENKPDESAFIDSLGWLYYKEGKFKDAAAELQKAITLPGGAQADVVRHLGDALYRNDRPLEAIEQWAEALQLLELSDSLTSTDRDQRDYLTHVLVEARAGRPAPVSPLASPEAAKAAGSATAPATGPQ